MGLSRAAENSSDETMSGDEEVEEDAEQRQRKKRRRFSDSIIQQRMEEDRERVCLTFLLLTTTFIIIRMCKSSSFDVVVAVVCSIRGCGKTSGPCSLPRWRRKTLSSPRPGTWPATLTTTTTRLCARKTRSWRHPPHEYVYPRTLTYVDR